MNVYRNTCSDHPKKLALERESSDSSVSESQRKEHVVIELIENDFPERANIVRESSKT